MQKYVGWYYSLSKPSGNASWNVSTQIPTSNIIRPHLTVANVIITVDSGNTNNCYTIESYDYLKPCTPSPIANILNSSLYAKYGGKNYFDGKYAPGSYAPSSPLRVLDCNSCNYNNS